LILAMTQTNLECPEVHVLLVTSQLVISVHVIKKRKRNLIAAFYLMLIKIT
jgi:hypothetical protein